MSKISKRLHEAIECQRSLLRRQHGERRNSGTEAKFEPVRKAAEELKTELADLPELKIEIEPESVWIGLYDKHFWFTYDQRPGVFTGSEMDTLWMEGGIRERFFEWGSAEACITAMIQACARYVALLDAIEKLSRERSRVPRTS
jgi:hypothetical protein